MSVEFVVIWAESVLEPSASEPGTARVEGLKSQPRTVKGRVCRGPAGEDDTEQPDRRKDEFLAMLAHESPPQRRQVTLTRWAIVETERSRRYFVGHCDDYEETRVSSVIVSFDVKALRGISISGRIYKLSGAPGRDAVADEVLTRWCQRNGITAARDVTEELLRVRKRE